MSRLRTLEPTFLMLFAGGALAACTANSVAQPSAMGSDGSASDGSASAHDAGFAEPVFDANAGTEFTHCVDGMPVAFRSLTESGGISPKSPRRSPARRCRSLRFRGGRCSRWRTGRP